MARVGSGYCTTDYAARSASYNRQRSRLARDGVRTNAPALVAAVENENPWAKRECVECGAETLHRKDASDPKCFDCDPGPFHGKGVMFSIDAGPEDSTHPDRVRQGTAGFNFALPGVVEEYGPKNAYGQRTILKKRPVANSEIASTRNLKEMAKKANMTPQDTGKRAVGGGRKR